MDGDTITTATIIIITTTVMADLVSTLAFDIWMSPILSDRSRVLHRPSAPPAQSRWRRREFFA
jgi:hypothetical protein